MDRSRLALLALCMALGNAQGCGDGQPKIYKSNRAELLKQQEGLPDPPEAKAGPAEFRPQPKLMKGVPKQ